MKLLVITQTVDKNDSTLGFFHSWLLALAGRCDKIIVICLYEGEHNLPDNVSVYSLGKENGGGKIKYLTRFFSCIWKYRKEYDTVFVHMNQEYILLGGFLWKSLGKKIFFWRNHPRGDFLTFLAVALSTKVFCTSSASFTTRFKKTVIMPAGIDIRLFRPVPGVVRAKYSVCMVGRVSLVKHIFEALQATHYLVEKGDQLSLTIIGNTGKRKEDGEYMNALKSYVSKNNLSPRIKFENAVAPENLPRIYSAYDICLNLTDNGSFDKTIVESAACGAVPVVSNKSLSSLLPDGCVTERNIDDIVSAIRVMSQPQNRLKIMEKLAQFVESQSLEALMKALSKEMDF